MDKLDNRIISLRNSKDAPFYIAERLSSYMFMSAFYPIHCFRASADMSDSDYKEMIDEVNNYGFFSG